MPARTLIAVRLLLSLLLLGTALVAAGCAPAATATPLPASQRAITVLGRATVSAAPDLVQASLGVETYAETVAEATQQNNAKMTSIMSRLRELGIADKDIQTANFSINFERYQGGDTLAGQYRVSNMVQLKIRDLEKVSPILDAAVQAGANQVWGVSFTIENQDILEAEARTKAVEDARRRADALAQLSQVQLGQILTVSESGVAYPMILGGGAAMAEGDRGAAPISLGEVQVTYQVQVAFAIE